MSMFRIALEGTAKDKKKKKKANFSKIKKGAFHEWLGKDKSEPITDADIAKGLRDKDPHVRQMAQFAKNAKKFHHKKKIAHESEAISVDDLFSAMEEISEADDDKTVILKGPLSEVYSKALADAYAKDNGQSSEQTTAVLESQQMDVAMVQKLSSAISDLTTAPTDNYQTIYGVSKHEVTQDDVVDMTSELVNAQDGRFILVLDATVPSQGGDVGGEEQKELLTSAMEQLVLAHGGQVYHSLPELVNNAI